MNDLPNQLLPRFPLPKTRSHVIESVLQENRQSDEFLQSGVGLCGATTRCFDRVVAFEMEHAQGLSVCHLNCMRDKPSHAQKPLSLSTGPAPKLGV